VLNPETNEDADGSVVVTDDTDENQLRHGEDEDSDSEDNKNSESDVDSEDGEESEEEDYGKDVDWVFHQRLMEVLQAGSALGGVEEEEEEEEEEQQQQQQPGDEATMALDQNLASLFVEQKRHIYVLHEKENKMQRRSSDGTSRSGHWI
jgi:DNA polymerase phi